MSYPLILCNFKGEEKSAQHFCSRCWKDKKVRRPHPANSSDCPRSDTDADIDVMDEWLPIIKYESPGWDWLEDEVDTPDSQVEVMKDSLDQVSPSDPVQRIIQAALEVQASGKPNRYGCKIPVGCKWDLERPEKFLDEYADKSLVLWLKYEWPLGRDPEAPPPQCADINHKGATRYPSEVDEYVAMEKDWGATIGPFKEPPFTNNLGCSPPIDQAQTRFT